MADITVCRGTAVKITGTFTDVNDVAFDPDEVYLSYTSPSGTTTTVDYDGGAGEITKDGTGIYSYWLDTRGNTDGEWSVTMYSDDTDTAKLVSDRDIIETTPADAVSS